MFMNSGLVLIHLVWAPLVSGAA